MGTFPFKTDGEELAPLGTPPAHVAILDWGRLLQYNNNYKFEEAIPLYTANAPCGQSISSFRDYYLDIEEKPLQACRQAEGVSSSGHALKLDEPEI